MQNKINNIITSLFGGVGSNHTAATMLHKWLQGWFRSQTTASFNNSLRPSDICVGKLTIIGSDNGLPPKRRQAIIGTNAGILLIGPLGTNFSGILVEIQTFSLKKILLKMSSAKCCSFRLGLNVITEWQQELYFVTTPEQHLMHKFTLDAHHNNFSLTKYAC